MNKAYHRMLLQTEEYQKDLDYLMREAWNLYDHAILRENKNVVVLITGVSGAIGANMLDAFMHFNQMNEMQKKPERFFVYGQTSNPCSAENELLDHRIYQSYYKPYALDIRDGIWDTKEYAYIFHLASNAEPKKYKEDPKGTRDIIEQGTEHVLKYAKKNPNAKVFIASTVEVYGRQEDGFHITEDNRFSYMDDKDEKNVYPIGKRNMEKQALQSAGGGCRVVVGRFSYMFGPTQSMDNSLLAAEMISKAAKGEDCNLSSEGKQIRGWTHISEGVACAFRMTAKGQAGTVLNIVSPNTYASMKEYAELCAKIGGSESRVGTGEKAEFDRGTGKTDAAVLSADKFMNMFPDFIYQFETLEDALDNAIKSKAKAVSTMESACSSN